MQSKIHIVWIRRDLRVSDHRPLALATTRGGKAVVCFVMDRQILQSLFADDRRVTFIQESLRQVDDVLRKHGSRLVVLFGDPTVEIPRLAQSLGAHSVTAGEDYEPYAKQRDATVEKTLRSLGIQFQLIKDQVVFSGSEIINQTGAPYRVFTPYKRAWLKRFLAEGAGVVAADARPDLDQLLRESAIGSKAPGLESLESYGFRSNTLVIEPGFRAANRVLGEFAQDKIQAYGDTRDLVAVQGTSSLSPHLRFGTLSIRTAVRACLAKPGRGSDTWLSELIWREFYQMILDRFPAVVDQAFQEKYRHIEWKGKPDHFEAWCAGQTGFPIIDAAMRHFNATGWMHNRLRMITASFLVKDLWIDWRKGEKYFADRLLDFDLASNNGGWQWCASTGADPQPYFRVFNPTLQAKKFDPDAAFIRSMLPERASESDKTIFEPKNPIVDHRTQSAGAVRMFSTDAQR